MCGIIGSVNHSLKIPVIKSTMLHRGPDEQTHFQYKNTEFYILRLAIQDIEDGQQPKHYLDRYAIIFNGEIYNHLELRQQYQLSCKTQSDTETILHLYHLLGKKCLDQLDGMFAFSILDKKENEIFLARDRAGEKPLYIFQKREKIVFASELNTLKSILPLEIKEENISNYLRLGFMLGEQTPYRNVLELKQGHFAKIDLNTTQIKIEKWWEVQNFSQKQNKDSFDFALRKTENLLQESVRRRLKSSDLEVGSFLSGGIDSGLVTAMAAKLKANLKTFTVSFSGTFDEAPLAKLAAEKYQTDHTEIHISFDKLAHDIEKIIGNYGEPFYDSSAIPSYYVSQEAKKHVTVVLNGDGADELFGGYRRYVPFNYFDLFQTSAIGKTFFKSAKWILPISHDKKSKYNYFYRLVDLLSKNNVERYLTATSDIFEGFEENIYNSSTHDFYPIFSKIYHSNSGLKKIMNLDFEIALAGDLLVKMDIATMANSLEGRSPFLSKELLEYIPSVNDDFKIRNRQTKYLLRQLAKQYLPSELIHQPKRGFEVPLKKWVENDLKEVIFSNLGENCYANNFVKKDFIQKLKADKVRVSKEKRAKILWTLFALEVWKKLN
ncbi:MAG: asparagine synthase (glutamine-hydrolyzing) [Saprospiraceae bacterium]